MQLKNARNCNSCRAVLPGAKRLRYECALRYPQGLKDGWEPIPLGSCPKPTTRKEMEAAEAAQARKDGRD
ncbi:MAG: hypothetical protein HQ582_04125 [Planctomycetes bacterium]|nr:hypothetical protein [Planctomycetota bacterium]